LQKIFKNVKVSSTPYVFGEPGSKKISKSDEELLESRQRQLEEHIMQAELNIKKQEEEIVGEAKTQAFYIVDEAKKQGEMEKQRLEQQGILDGLELAARHYCSEYMQMLQYKQDLKQRCEERIHNIEEQVLDTALVLTRKILDIEIARNDEAVLAAFKEALETVKDDEELIMEMSPENCERVESAAIKYKFKTKANEKFGIDEMLLHSDHGTIDATVSHQFENLKNALLEKLE